MKFMQIITLLAGLFLLPFLAVSKTFNVKDYGAAGDGRTDDYLAIKAVFNKVNVDGAGEIYFPPGEYYIGRYHGGNASVEDFEIKNCSGVRIYGRNAIIRLNGSFHRVITRRTEKNLFSNLSSIIPLKITNSKNVVVEELEVDGGVNGMTRVAGVVEQGGSLVLISQSENVTLKNLYLHHAQTDGVLITGKDKPSRQISALKVVSSNNARQGMSIGFLMDGQFTDCRFINTGFSEGRYGSHAPGAGVDIEPAGKGKMVENILFERCLFQNNVGSQFIVSSPEVTRNVLLKDCIIEAMESRSKYTVILAAREVQLQKCKIKCGDGNIYPLWNGMHGGSTTIEDCDIESSSRGIVADKNIMSKGIKIMGNRLKFTGSQLSSYFPYLQNKSVSFANNRIFIPSHLIQKKKLHALIQNASKSSGNVFYTQDKNIKPKVSYSGTKVVNDL